MGGDGSTDLVSEASNICETMKGNPMFESIMGMQQSMMGNMNPNPAGYSDTSHNSSKTRERLQKKLQQKQQSNDNE